MNVKKTMVAGIAAICATATFALESANIVGYQKIENRQGNTLQVATFNAVGGEGYNIQEIIPVGDTVVGGGETTIQTLTAAKATAKMFYWLTDDEWGTDNGENGWFEDPNNTEEFADYTFDPGEGFIFASANGSASVTYAGEVKYPVELAMTQGNSLCGNFWPKDMSLQQIVPAGATVVGGGETTIQTLTAAKATAKMFYWLTDDEWGTDNGENGWFEDPNNTEEFADYVFQPGEGYIFASANGPATLNFPEL